MKTRLEHLNEIIDRLQKEIVYYNKEIIAENKRIETLLSEKTELAEYKVKKYREVLGENIAALKDCEKQLKKFTVEKGEILEADAEDNAENERRMSYL